MHLVYDVSHNIAKVEEHMVNGRPKTLLVHRKGATRAFPPHHPLIPVDYQFTGTHSPPCPRPYLVLVADDPPTLAGQPVLIGGTMGTYSYVLLGTEQGMQETFGSTCHGAGRALSRSSSRRELGYEEVLANLARKGISIRVASPKLVTEEVPHSFTTSSSCINNNNVNVFSFFLVSCCVAQAPESYKDVNQVVDTCHQAGISKKCIKLRPIAVIKG